MERRNETDEKIASDGNTIEMDDDDDDDDDDDGDDFFLMSYLCANDTSIDSLIGRQVSIINICQQNPADDGDRCRTCSMDAVLPLRCQIEDQRPDRVISKGNEVNSGTGRLCVHKNCSGITSCEAPSVLLYEIIKDKDNSDKEREESSSVVLKGVIAGTLSVVESSPI